MGDNRTDIPGSSLDDYVLVQDSEGVERILRQIDEATVVNWDVETSGLSWQKNHVVGYVVKPLHMPSTYIPVRHAGGGNLPGCSVPETPEGWRGDLHPFEIELAKRVRKDPNKRWVGHNFAFDLKFNEKHGIDLLGHYEDTQINAALIDENLGFYSLEKVALWLEVKPKVTTIYEHMAELFGGAADKKQMAHFWRLAGNDPQTVEYACGDGTTTEQVWEEQQIELDKQDLRRVWNVECRLIRTLHRMTSRGIRIDEEALQRVHKLFVDHILQARRSLPSMDFNCDSPKAMKELFAAYIDSPTWPRTAPTLRFPTGSPQFNEAILKTVPEGQAVLNVRKFENARDSFTTPLMERHMFRGRVHCQFNQVKQDDYGTVTGRLSSSDPNMQQVPKRDKVVGLEYRKVFVPEEGHIWRSNDYKQQEYVVFTDYTRDPTLMAGYMQDPPVDIHQSVALMLNVERDPTAKRMNLGMLYGMGKDKMAASLGVDRRTAELWIAAYHQRFPSAKKFLRKAEDRMKQHGFVFTYLGRRRRITDGRFAYKAGNGVIQGSSADVSKLKMVEIDDYFESEGDHCRLLLQCHDSIDWSQPIGMDPISDEAIRIMQAFGPGDQITMGLPLRTDSTQGKNWSEATYG